MRILIVGSGGREHALVWKLATEPRLTALFAAPGNPGMAALARTVPIPADDLHGLTDFAANEGIDLTIVGPELPLARGLVDLFSSRGLRIFGPSQAAAQLECSKVFAKHFMARHGVPTARYRVCDSADTARECVRSAELGFPLVVKADGLAAGKGVVVAPDGPTAEDAITAAMDTRQFGEAGSRVVLEECLQGPEVSFFAICDGRRALPVASAQDHKRIFDDDQGPNTGGMGAFAPSPLMDGPMQTRVLRDIVEPVLRGMCDEGREYRGFLYVGLMLTCDGPKVIEFNVRFGDPEAQVVIPMIGSELASVLAAAADGCLGDAQLPLLSQKHVGVVLASRGYPQSSPTGLPIAGLEEAAQLEGLMVFHAGTATGSNGEVVTAGGRVLTIVGRDSSFDQAIARAYQGVARISFEGMQYRRDIGRKALLAVNAAGGANTGRS